VDEAVISPLLPDELVNAHIVVPAGGDANDDVHGFKIRCGLLLGSNLSNAPVAESTHTQYNRENSAFIIYLWDKQLLKVLTLNTTVKILPL
jgi:hypothetical protein